MAGQPQNNSSANRAALRWLNEAKEHAPEHGLHLLTLAWWGLENGAEGEWPSRDRPALESQVGLMAGWQASSALRWLQANPDGPENQAEDLAAELAQASSPKAAAAIVLNAIYSRLKSQVPALQPAASALS